MPTLEKKTAAVITIAPRLRTPNAVVALARIDIGNLVRTAGRRQLQDSGAILSPGLLA